MSGKLENVPDVIIWRSVTGFWLLVAQNPNRWPVLLSSLWSVKTMNNVYACQCYLAIWAPISFPEPANFLRHMLDENEGSGKDQFLGDPDWLSEIQYNKSAIYGLLEPVLSRALRFHRACAVRSLKTLDTRLSGLRVGLQPVTLQKQALPSLRFPAHFTVRTNVPALH